MTRQEAADLANLLQPRLHPSKLWAITVDECKKVGDRPQHYRVVIHTLGGEEPIAIYSARLLKRQLDPGV